MRAQFKATATKDSEYQYPGTTSERWPFLVRLASICKADRTYLAVSDTGCLGPRVGDEWVPGYPPAGTRVPGWRPPGPSTGTNSASCSLSRSTAGVTVRPGHKALTVNCPGTPVHHWKSRSPYPDRSLREAAGA
eukprot:2809855-Rhodomonas_salina.2